MIRQLAFCSAALLIGFCGTANAQEMSLEAVNSANPLKASGDGPNPGILRLQVMLDRAGASTGWIDGYMGPSTTRAIRAFETMRGLEVDGELDEAVWKALDDPDRPAMKRYTLTEEDVDIKLVENFDKGDYETMRALDCLCYHRHSEAIAEKFHMDEDLLKRLNPDGDFAKAGTKIVVVDPGDRVEGKVTRVVVDKGLEQVLGYDAEDRLIVAHRAAIGSRQNPSPSGKMEVEAVALDPTYTYKPEENFGKEDGETFVLPPGPNGPVGNVWIDLSKPTYGIHGTPHPEELNTMASHGCVRLTNWDARELAYLVEAGVAIEFKE